MVRGDKEKEKIDAVEQYGRRQNLGISGISANEDKNTSAIVEEVAKLVNSQISADQISTAHRLPAKPKRAAGFENKKDMALPSIIVQFLSRDIRNELYQTQKLLRNADFKNFSIQGTHKISTKILHTLGKSCFGKLSKKSKRKNTSLFGLQMATYL